VPGAWQPLQASTRITHPSMSACLIYLLPTGIKPPCIYSTCMYDVAYLHCRYTHTLAILPILIPETRMGIHTTRCLCVLPAHAHISFGTLHTVVAILHVPATCPSSRYACRWFCLSPRLATCTKPKHCAHCTPQLPAAPASHASYAFCLNLTGAASTITFAHAYLSSFATGAHRTRLPLAVALRAFDGQRT